MSVYRWWFTWRASGWWCQYQPILISASFGEQNQSEQSMKRKVLNWEILLCRWRGTERRGKRSECKGKNTPKRAGRSWVPAVRVRFDVQEAMDGDGINVSCKAESSTSAQPWWFEALVKSMFHTGLTLAETQALSSIKIKPCGKLSQNKLEIF